MTLLQKIFGDPNAREILKLQPVLQDISDLESSLTPLTHEELIQKTGELRKHVYAGASLDDVLPEAFALTREAARRALNQRHFDVQLIGGMALHHGMIAEMRTGEGKTLTATAPVYLNALTGKGVHVITVNDYLARRDTVWMGQIYHALGLSVGCIQHAGSFVYDPSFKTEPSHDEQRDATGAFRVDMDYLRPVSRREAYAADITYGTNNEFGFDFLRDNMVTRQEDRVQRELHYAIIDEVDSILIDEARTPLIISAPAEEAADMYYRFADLVTKLDAQNDYTVDEKMRAVALTDGGIGKVETLLGVENLYIQAGLKMVRHLEQALRAHALYKRDRDYVVKDNEVIIVDEFTGRLMIGRRYSEGLHQAIEAKERVTIQRESVTLATITFQNYFRLYQKLAGMTGTAATEAEEFHKIYKLEVLSIPTHRENHRDDLPDRVYKSELGKFQAVVREIKERHAKGQPILVGTVSIEKNELLGALLAQANIPHALLNAKQHEHEAEIIAQAGRRGAVTVATNMAGRGVDIILGGNPPSANDAQEVRELGGLFVLGTERHESRRIDNQLRGRSGRQGDPGATQFYVSMEDDLMRIFGSDRMKAMMDRLGLPEDEAIENGVLTKSIAAAQRKVEGHNFDIRKHLLEYDDVLNKHRMVIYKKRGETLAANDLKQKLMEMVEAHIERIVAFHSVGDDPSLWDTETIAQAMRALFSERIAQDFGVVLSTEPIQGREDAAERRTRAVAKVVSFAQQAYTDLATSVGDASLFGDVAKSVMLKSMDDLWIEHLESIDHLRHGVHLQGYGQRDPLVEYKREAYRLFQDLIAAIDERVTRTMFHIHISRDMGEQEQQRSMRPLAFHAPEKEGASTSARSQPSSEKIGRNATCPCGSGKKYKKCHGV